VEASQLVVSEDLMRVVVLLPLAVAAAAGCGSAKIRQTASVSERDLTLSTTATESAVASPLELQRPVPRETKQLVRRTHRRAAVTFQPTIVPAVLHETIARTPVAPTPAAEPVAVIADPHELLPGKTVTIIPTSSGPAPTTENPRDPSEARGAMGGTIGIGGGGHGGGCHGRGGGGSGMGGRGGIPPAILR
jgi:hypothetical protein